MDNQILQSDCSELPTQRLQAKILFLLQENDQSSQLIKQLKEQLKEANHIIELLNQNSEISLKQSNQKLIDQLRIKEKNSEEIVKQRDFAQSKALLNEQVKIQSEMFLNDTLREYEEKIQELRRIIHDKEYSVQQLEKIKAIQDNQGTYFKIKELITLNEQSLKYHDDLENSYLAIKKQQKDLEKQIDLTNKYIEENKTLKFELAKIKYALQNQMNYCKIRESLNFTKEILSDDESNLLNLKKPVIFSLKNKGRKSMTDYQIKTLPVQEQSEGKSINAHITSFISPQNEIKISRIEQDLERTKKLFERELLNNRLLSDQLGQCQQHNLNLQHTNNILIKSQKMSENTIQLLRQKIFFLEKFWKKFLTNILQVDDIQDAYNINDLKELLADQQSLPNFTCNVQLIAEKNDNHNLRRIYSQKQLSLKIYDTVYQDSKKSNAPSGELVGEFPNITYNESRVYLLSLAKDLNQSVNFTKEQIGKLQSQTQRISVRSLSSLQNYKTHRLIQIPCLRKLDKSQPIKIKNQLKNNINIDDISVILPQNIDQNELLIQTLQGKNRRAYAQVDQSFISQQDFLQLN